MNRDEEYAFYEDPENQAPQGPGRRRKTALTHVVPVRLAPETLEAVRQRASAEGRSVSNWMRHLILSALADDSPRGTRSTLVQGALPELPPSIMPLRWQSLTIDPREALEAQLVLSAERVVSDITRSLERLRAALVHDLEDVFKSRHHMDEDLFFYRSQSYATDFRDYVIADIQATESAIVRLARLAAIATVETSPSRISAVRDEISRLRTELHAVEGQVLEAPKTRLSEIAEWGLLGFYEYLDHVQRILHVLDEDLYRIATEAPVVKPSPRGGTGRSTRQR